MEQKKRSATSWLAEFAGPHKKLYISSVTLAIAGVICSIIPYFIIGRMVGH